jgi:hypothetical protein
MTGILILPLLGCEEFVNPKVEVKGVPVLHCIIPTSGEGANAFVEAELTRVYDVDGLDPSVNKSDPFIPGAEITLFYRTKSYIMREGSSPRRDTSRYSTRQRFYWATLPPLSGGDSVALVAKVPTGEVLTASVIVPQWQYFETSIEFASGFTTQVNRFNIGESWTFTWNEEEDHIFFPRMILSYHKLDSVQTRYAWEVPLSYLVRNGVGTPVFPSYQWSNSASYALSSFDTVMTQISADDPEKLQYKIDFLTFSLIECDRSLSRYYSSVRGYLDEYSVRLDESVFTNINGGIGVFGSYRASSINFSVNLAYVHLFGYQ